MSLENLHTGDLVPVPPKPKSEDEVIAGWEGDINVPLVSVACHTYNHVDYIKNALDSFLSQKTSFPFEVIVHDDASTDGTADIVREYAERFPTLIKPILQTENQYSQGFRPFNYSFPKIRGKYIAVCEGDDYWVSYSKLEKQARHMKDNPNCSLSFHDSAIIDSNGFVVELMDDFGEGDRFSTEDIIRSWFVMTSSIMFKKASLCQYIDHIKGVVNGDWFIQLVCSLDGSIDYVESGFSAYRKHPGGMSRFLANEKSYAVMKLILLLDRFNYLSEYEFDGQIERRKIEFLDGLLFSDRRRLKRYLYYAMHPKESVKRIRRGF